MRVAIPALTVLALVASSPMLAGLARTASGRAAEASSADGAASIDELMAGLYAGISGGVGEARDWDRVRALFVPEARMIAIGRRPDGGAAHREMTIDGYIETNGPRLVEMGFREEEVRRSARAFPNNAVIVSEYATYRGDEADPFGRGVNFIHAARIDGAWKVVSISWEAVADRSEADPLFE